MNTSEIIDNLKENEIFVFGSNEGGKHNGGAARVALIKFGAIYGECEGLFGQTYAIPTLSTDFEQLDRNVLLKYINNFITFVKNNSDKIFYLTKIGCGIAGYEIEYIKDILWEVIDDYDKPNNLIIPIEFEK